MQKESDNENRVEIITYPKYIIYDFETDTSTDIHKPNHVEIDILQMDETLTHTYESCLQKNFKISGYGCETKFCDWLFTQKKQIFNSYST